MQNKTWVPVRNFPNYLVSDFGEVKRIKNDKVKSSHIGDRGYAVINLYDTPNKTWKSKKLSRIVWESFNDCSCAEVVDHIDGNKTNNQLSNLRCITHSENLLGKEDYSRDKNKYNLNDDIKREIISKFRSGEWTSTDIFKKFDLPSNYLFTIVKRGTWDKLLNERSVI